MMVMALPPVVTPGKKAAELATVYAGHVADELPDAEWRPGNSCTVPPAGHASTAY